MPGSDSNHRRVLSTPNEIVTLLYWGLNGDSWPRRRGALGAYHVCFSFSALQCVCVCQRFLLEKGPQSYDEKTLKSMGLAHQ